MKKSVFLMTIIVCLIALATSPQVMAQSYGLDVILDTGQPSGQDPWLIATFDDKDSNANIPDNTVWLTMNADNLGYMHNAERVTNWYFNYNPSYSAYNDLTFEGLYGTTGFLEVDGAGVFDFTFGFTDFKTGEMKVTITKQNGAEIPNLTAAAFDFVSQEYPDLSTPVFAPNGVRNTVAYVQKPGEDENGFDGYIGNIPNSNPIPEPATLLLLGVGLVGLAGFGRKKLNK